MSFYETTHGFSLLSRERIVTQKQTVTLKAPKREGRWTERPLQRPVRANHAGHPVLLRSRRVRENPPGSRGPLRNLSRLYQAQGAWKWALLSRVRENLVVHKVRQRKRQWHRSVWHPLWRERRKISQLSSSLRKQAAGKRLNTMFRRCVYWKQRHHILFFILADVYPMSASLSTISLSLPPSPSSPYVSCIVPNGSSQSRYLTIVCVWAGAGLSAASSRPAVPQ